MAARPALPAPLPPQPTTFVGREAELAELARLLAASACRLVTVSGPGGSGKTRLALEAAARAGGAFADGVAFAPLETLPAADLLPAAIAQAIGGPRSGPSEPRARLLAALRRKRLLLLLDNLEHLLPGVDLLAEILAAAPGVVVLATSREALNLREEWRFPLGGLAAPACAAPDELERSEAARLFVERARRARHDFDPAAEGAGVARICRLVGGLPLALELAAAWTTTLPCAAIADEIAGNAAVLATGLRNVPARHRSVRAAFAGSWALLSEGERRAFRALALFRGGFRREAAERVAGATLPILAALVDKSLVRLAPDGRYSLHELLRQYAAERLAEAPDEAARVERAHGAYYTGFLADRFEAIVGGGQREAIAAVAADFENVRAAWQWALAGGEVGGLYRAAHTLYLACDVRGLYAEGVAAEEAFIRRLRDAAPTPPAGLTLAAALVDVGWLYIRTGQLGQSRAAFEEARGRYDALGLPLPPGLATDPLLGLGVLALIAGDYAGAARLGEEARRRAEAQGHRTNLPYAWYVLCQAALARGQYAEARSHARQAQAAVRVAGDRWFTAYCLLASGDVARALGEQDEARAHYRAAYAIREEFADREGMAIALAHLGKVALLAADHEEARRLYARSQAIYEDLADRGGLATALHGLGLAAAATGTSPRRGPRSRGHCAWRPRTRSPHSPWRS